jgi:hypothetical protein
MPTFWRMLRHLQHLSFRLQGVNSREIVNEGTILHVHPRQNILRISVPPTRRTSVKQCDSSRPIQLAHAPCQRTRFPVAFRSSFKNRARTVIPMRQDKFPTRHYNWYGYLPSSLAGVYKSRVARRPGRTKSVLWRLTLVHPQYETCSMSHIWEMEFWDGSYIVKFVYPRS